MCIITALGSIGLALGIGGATITTGAAAGTVVATTSSVIAGGLAVAGAGAAVAGTALGAVGSYQQGKAQQAAYNYQAQVAEQNRQIALNNAAMERQSGLEEARRQRIATLQAVGKQQVSLAANGVDVGYGTSLDIIEDTSMLGELDALMIEYDSEKKARNYEIEANNFANETNLANFSSRNARTAGNINAAAGGLKTVGTLVNSFTTLGGGANAGFGSLIGKANKL